MYDSGSFTLSYIKSIYKAAYGFTLVLTASFESVFPAHLELVSECVKSKAVT